MPASLHALVVDDEQPVLDELVWLLQRDDRIASVRGTHSGTDALRLLEQGGIDLVFLDVAMPGLSGLDIARLLGHFRAAPQIVFVTAHEAHAVEAFEMNAVDYLLKPIREERLRESVRRASAGADADRGTSAGDEQIAVELGGVTRFVSRASVAHAEAQGDYVRLHVADGASHLVRTPLGTLADEWADAGFVRIHRSIVVNLAHVREVRVQAGRCSVVVPSGTELVELQVARRHTRALRDLIHERAL
ncbi:MULTISPECIES: LytTR family DNA-binding domain-containing protein [Aeromicrobium]|uniref:LytR/AlgR family response regulator transcription factor n=1 Tax=Aeromicrobium TaxID=2040 RepID=UPI0006FEDA0D|nr:MULTISPECIES: LytTR family DNA-binding domain-containing protein [Aeromicrobium]KQX73920.1 LytR family transcriptional regulator [Aeromicrobium sp. Root472D3]MCL8252285.1 LytTR family DNA-binding domain-containing protein [Aeromicrobium fastidiosum]